MGWARGRHLVKVEYYHTNSLEVLPDSAPGRRDPRFRKGNLLVSLRNADTVVILDGQTLKPVWSWGRGVLQLQHMPTFIRPGHILVFDNGPRRRWSRVLELDPVTDAVTWEWPRRPDPAFFSAWRGSDPRLPNGDTLICECERGHVIEVTPDGRVAWEFWNPEMSKKGRKRIYRFRRLSPERAELLLPADAMAGR